MQARWCYPIERCLKTLRKKCTNKARIEASIAEASIREEVANFTIAYYKHHFPIYLFTKYPLYLRDLMQLKAMEWNFYIRKHALNFH